MSTIHIREAVVNDSELILQLITELAVYEKAGHEVLATKGDLESSLFSSESTANAVICEIDNTPVGFAVYFFNYSTWLGKNGLYLEDLYISPEYRHMGAGTALLKYLANIALSKECGRFEWSVLDWNEPAIKLYQSIGAMSQDEWVSYRLDGENLKKFAAQ